MRLLSKILLVSLHILIIDTSLNITYAQSSDVSKSIGVILPLTGPFTEFGIAMKNGIEIAKENNKELDGINFIFQDSQYSPQQTISIYHGFLSNSNIKAIINFGCPTSQAIVPLAEKHKMPTALFCSSMLITQNKKYSFAITPPASEWAKILFKHLQKKSFNKPCIVLTDNDYLVSEYNAINQEYVNSGHDKISLVDRHLPTDNDFRSSILRIKAKGCDALGVYLLPGQVSKFLQTLNNYKYNATIFGTDIFESKSEITASQGLMENSSFVGLAVPDSFKSNYVARYSNDSQITAACVAHDVATMLSAVIKNNQQFDNEVLAGKMRSAYYNNLKCGNSNFVKSITDENYIDFPLALKQILNNQALTVKE